MNTSTGTKEKNPADDSGNKSGLKLVRCENPKAGSNAKIRSLRIGVASDVFRTENRETPDSPKSDPDAFNVGGMKTLNERLQRAGTVKFGTVLGVAAVGLILGYFIGRRPRG